MIQSNRFQVRRTASRFGLVPVLLVLALSSIAAQGASPASANAGPPSDAVPSYEELDANKDGIVTLPEVVVHNPALAKRIAHCDSDNNKVLSRKELAACHPKHAGAAVAHADHGSEK